MNADQATELLASVLGDHPWPKPLHLLRGRSLVLAGTKTSEAARLVGTTATRLEEVASSPNPLRDLTGLEQANIGEANLAHARLILGQLLLGRCAEMVFEEAYRSEMHAHELELRDVRESRTDTDYRLYNGQGRALYRINIKFHGARFRRAPDLVRLDPADCFALATYKIFNALQKQDEERLPYIFAIVGVPTLSGERVGSGFHPSLVELLATLHSSKKVSGKRDIEDAIVDAAVRSQDTVFRSTYDAIARADWYVLSARKADRLLKELLFERVFALRVRGFARVFRGAELDMHFSLSRDLTPLPLFLRTLREEGLTKVATLMERGEV